GTFFFVGVLACWAVLVPAKLWAGRPGGRLRRVILLLLGALVGLGGLWLDGWAAEPASAGRHGTEPVGWLLPAAAWAPAAGRLRQAAASGGGVMAAVAGKGRFPGRLPLWALAAGLLVLLARAGAADRPPPPAPWTVEGYGETAAAAERVAFRKAAARVGALL